jgi:integrase
MGRPAKPSLYVRDGVWHYRFTAHGQRFRGSTGERDRGRAANFLAARWYEEHRGAKKAAPGPLAGLDLADLAGLWLAELELQAGEHGPQFVKRHKLDTRYILKHFTHAQSVTDAAWQNAMRALHADGLSWRSLQHATVTLRHLMRFAAESGAIAAAPELRPPKNRLVTKTERKRRALTESERDRVIVALRRNGDDRPARAWTAMAYSGLRKGELARLTLRWLDVGAGVLRIPASAAKSGEDEEVLLHPKVRQAVRAEAAERGIKPDQRDVPVFGGFDIRKAWKRALVRAKVDATGLTAHHSARHTFGTLLAQYARGDVTAVQAGGRWRSLAMVQRYVHANVARAREAMRRL